MSKFNLQHFGDWLDLNPDVIDDEREIIMMFVRDYLKEQM